MRERRDEGLVVTGWKWKKEQARYMSEILTEGNDLVPCVSAMRERVACSLRLDELAGRKPTEKYSHRGFMFTRLAQDYIRSNAGQAQTCGTA